MQWGKLLGWGIVIYAVMFLLWQGLVVYGSTTGIVHSVVVILALVVVTSIAGRSLHFDSPKDILPYSLGWALIALFIDAALAAPGGSWQLFADPNVWIGYTLLAVVPLFAATNIANSALRRLPRL